MANLLVTGGAGFIGSNFVHYWRAHHPNDGLVVLDSLTYAGNRANIANVADITFVNADIRDYQVVAKLIADHNLDTIVHFAAESHVDRSIHGPDAFIDTNINGTHTLLKAAKAQWLDRGLGRPHRFHHVSTDEVYGSLEPNAPAFSEHSPYQPNSPYSASKAASDHLVRAYHHTYGLQTTISNCSNNYGPYQFPEKLIPFFLTNALLGKTMPIYGDGKNVRDWLYVEDHCAGIALVLRRGREGDTYNIGGRSELANLQVVEAICSELDAAFSRDATMAERFRVAPMAEGRPTASLKEFVKDRLGHDRRYAINETKVRTELGFVPQRDFVTGLRQTLNWYLDNESWWRPLLARQNWT